MEGDPIIDSPPKRRKVEPDSDSDDYGPNVFDQADETIATLVQPFHSSPTPEFPSPSRVASSSPAPHQTQPTQVVPATPKKDQLLSQILVPRTSPPSEKRAIAPLPRASLAAPPGTMLRPPTFYRAANTVSSAGSPVSAASESDDDMARSRLDIPQTKFRAGNSIDKFKMHVSSFAHTPSSSPPAPAPPSTIPQKRAAEDSVGAYANISRSIARSVDHHHKQPAAKIVPAVHKVLDVDDIADWELKAKTAELKTVFSDYSAQELYDALVYKRGNKQDAMDYLVAKEESQKAAVVDLTTEDDELAPSPAQRRVEANKPTTAKRTLNVPQQSVIQRFGGAQRKPTTTQPGLSSQEPASSSPEVAKPPRKRLVQGLRAHAPSQESHQSSPAATDVVELLDSDSDVEEEPEDDQSLSVEDEVLKWLNTCSDKDMVEIAGCDLEIANLMVSKRPFKTLTQASNVKKEETVAKNGKNRGGSRKPVGERVVTVAREAHTSFAAVDRLAARCSQYSTMIKKQMQIWGILNDEDAHSDDSVKQDSGIGTPLSAYKNQSARKTSITLDIAQDKFIGQPGIMSESLTLKDYQVVGLNWLNLLWTNKLSCILADEMGLGKTVQVIAFLSHLKESNVPGPHLVVVPASTLVNWLREFEKFSPDLQVQPYHGPETERRSHAFYLEDNRNAIDVIVTTYEMAVKPGDNAVFRRIRPTVCVFDEGHALKNKTSKRYTALMRIPAQFRLLLTGTPLQNNLQEMVSILAFLMPKMFEDAQDDLEYIFKHKAKTTDEDHAVLLSAQRISRARSIITPFLLRRKKATVLTDLPKKTSRVEYCGMTTRQKEVYDEHSGYHTEHMKARAAGLDVATSVNFLMNRRKAALHPLLFRHHYTVDKVAKISKMTPKKRSFKHFKDDACMQEHFELLSDIALHKHCVDLAEKEGLKTSKLLLQNNEWMDSGKVEKLVEILKQHAANGDRTLLFSQFTMVLDVLELVLNTLNQPFLRIDGDTPVQIRQDLIDQYYADPSIRVFMLSTRSGGTGINLAAANKVIIFDSSFNPQDDVQAENRAHRVGQTREVEVIRLVTSGTVEEQIHRLGESKLALDERVAGDGDEAERKGQATVEKELMKKMLEGNYAEDDVKDNEVKDEQKDLKEEFKNGLLARGVAVA